MLDFTLPSLLKGDLSREEHAVSLEVGKDQISSDAQFSGKQLFRNWKCMCKTAQRYSVKDACKSQLSSSDSEANSDEKTSKGSKYSKSNASCNRISQQNNHSVISSQQSLLYFQVDGMSKLERSKASTRFFTSPSPKTEPRTDPTVLSILNCMENSPFDLCHVLLSLLEKVCKFDMTINHNSGLAVRVVPTLTGILTALGDCCRPEVFSVQERVDEPAEGWTEEPIALVQRMLLRTILHLMFANVGQSDELPDNLCQSISDLLRATLEIRNCFERRADPFAPRHKQTSHELQEIFSIFRYHHRVFLLPELFEGVLHLLSGCLQVTATNPFFFSQSLELVHEFVHHHGLELFEEILLYLETIASAYDLPISGEAKEHLHRIIAGVFKIISAIKKAKAEQLHQTVCARRRHRHCEYSHFLHHHSDLSGLPVSAFKQATQHNPFEDEARDNGGQFSYPDRGCVLAACAYQFLHLLQRLSHSGSAVLQVLTGVQSVGICCCMDPETVIRPLLYAFQTPALCNYRTYILSVLSQFVLDQLGGGQHSVKVRVIPCKICTLDSSQISAIKDNLLEIGPDKETTSSGMPPPFFLQGDLRSKGPKDMLWKWNVFKAYQEIVFGEDMLLSKQISGHVCRLILRGNEVTQWHLYNHIFNPLLQRGVELAYHLQQIGVSNTCSQVCSYCNNGLTVEVLLVYLQSLPLLLMSR